MKKRKDGRWQKSVTVNGKRVFLYSSADTERQAQRDFSRQLMDFKDRETRGKMFGQVAEEWERTHFPRLAHQTAVRYKTLKNHAVEWFEDQTVKEITPEQIAAFLAYFAENGYSQKTIKDQRSVLRMIFRFAVVHRCRENDPTAYIELPKGKPKVERQPLTDQEIAAVENNADDMIGLFAYLLLYTGLRKSEALALQWQDIDLKARKINVTKSLYYVGNTPYVKEPKTAAGKRKVIIPDCLFKKLHKGFHDAYLFERDGKPLTLSAYDDEWRAYQKKIGCHFTAHQLRHQYATMLFEANVPASAAQYLMGHSTVTMTEDVYTHIRQSYTRVLERTVNGFIEQQKLLCCQNDVKDQ